MDKLIKSIIKDMESDRTVDEISKRSRVEKALVEEILQIYTTHPGIDVSCDIGPDNKVMMRLLPDYAVFRHDDNQKNGSFPLTRSETS